VNKKLVLLILLTLIITLCFSGCIPGDGICTKDKPAGLLWGIWHGWVAPVSLIIGLFNSKIHLFEVNNTGWWYEFGFYIAIIGGFGGLSIIRKKKKG